MSRYPPPWDRGWIEMPRAVSDLYDALTVREGAVLTALYRIANYKPARLMTGAEVGAGQTAKSLATIAKAAKVSIKVARNTLDKLKQGTETDGLGPVLNIEEGTPKGTGPRLISLRHYRRPPPLTDEEGTREGTGGGTTRARGGHAEGTDRKKEKKGTNGSQFEIRNRDPGSSSCAEVTGANGGAAASAPSAANADLLTFPCVGPGLAERAIRPKEVADWALLFPGVDVPAALRTMRAWLLANPKRRKTAKGVPRFVVAWLTREQERARGAAPGARPPGPHSGIIPASDFTNEPEGFLAGPYARETEPKVQRWQVVEALKEAGLYLGHDGEDEPAIRALLDLGAPPREITRQMRALRDTDPAARPSALVAAWPTLGGATP